MTFIDTKKCLICQNEKGRVLNDLIYWHLDPDSNDIWCWCNREDRGYSIFEYCAKAGVSLSDFLKQDFTFREVKNNELSRIEWPKNFVPLFSAKAADGVEYLKSRDIDPVDGMYYDIQRKGIVFPYHYDQYFCGAQIRFLEPWIDSNGDKRKIDTLPGTRLGLLIYNWNQKHVHPHTKAFIVTEGAFNALAIQQAFNRVYGDKPCPYRCVALSGSGASEHHREVFKEQISKGMKVILAPDSDKAGAKMLKKMQEADAITHFAFTGDDEYDWNDVYKEMEDRDFVRWFLERVTNVKSTTSNSEKNPA